MVALASHASPARAAEIWLAAVDPLFRRALHWDNSSVDYMDLFKPDAPWQTVAARTAVFKIGPGFAQQGTEDELRTVFADLRRRNIALALEMGPLIVSERCPEQSEAASMPGTLEGILDRIKRFGGVPTYFAMDEPLVFGLWHRGEKQCVRTMPELARDIGKTVSLIRRFFPGIAVGDIETVDNNRQHLEDLQSWPAIYREAAGENLAFLHVDIAWSDHAMRNLVPLAKSVQAERVPFGLIYNGGLPTADDVWAQRAERNFTEIESELGIRPDTAIFQTWVQSPSHMLPETQRGTFTNIVYRYLLPRGALTVVAGAGALSGALTDEAGRPIAGAPISLQAIDIGGVSPLAEHVVGDVVPPNAAAALIGVRINAEGACICSGPAVAMIGGVTYREAAAASRTAFSFDEDAPRRYAVTAADHVIANSRSFPVTPGAPFTLTVRATVNWHAEDGGYVSVIFLDKKGDGISRVNWRFRPNHIALGTTPTDQAGHYRHAIDPDLAREGYTFQASYEGAGQLRSAMASTARR